MRFHVTDNVLRNFWIGIVSHVEPPFAQGMAGDSVIVCATTWRSHLPASVFLPAGVVNILPA